MAVWVYSLSELCMGVRPDAKFHFSTLDICNVKGKTVNWYSLFHTDDKEWHLNQHALCLEFWWFCL